MDAESRPSHPYGAPDRGFGHDGYAAISETSRAAMQFCVWLSAKTGKKYRLPTEAEWEFACRAGGPGGKLDREELKKVAWFWENSEEQPHPVGKKAPNAWGLYDMLGNVGEWAIGLDGKPVLCGGTWQDKAGLVHPGAPSALHRRLAGDRSAGPQEYVVAVGWAARGVQDCARRLNNKIHSGCPEATGRNGQMTQDTRNKQDSGLSRRDMMKTTAAVFGGGADGELGEATSHMRREPT